MGVPSVSFLMNQALTLVTADEAIVHSRIVRIIRIRLRSSDFYPLACDLAFETWEGGKDLRGFC